MTLGLEVEYWVVDERGRLCDGRDLVECHEHVVPEFVGPLLEIKTSPHESVRSLGREFQETLTTVLDAAEATGRHLVPLGTPLTEHESPATSERGELFEQIYGDRVTSPKNCAGTHIHFGKTEVARQLDLLTALDPAVALVSSSPYYCGERTVNCARAQAYRKDCGEQFEQYCDLWAYRDDVAAWEASVQTNYDEFVEIAIDRGIDESTVRALFDPEDTVLAPVRLRHELPTVEWRAPDAALPSQLLRLAGDVDRLMAAVERKPVTTGEPGIQTDRVQIPAFDELQSLSDEAIRWGLDSPRVREYLESMGFDTSRYEPLSASLCGPGTLTRDEARQIRLNCADRLRVDVDALGRNRFVHPPVSQVQYSMP